MASSANSDAVDLVGGSASAKLANWEDYGGSEGLDVAGPDRLTGSVSALIAILRLEPRGVSGEVSGVRGVLGLLKKLLGERSRKRDLG